MSIFDRLKSKAGGKAGSVNHRTDTWFTTPWSWRDTDGTYVGHNRDVWLYREVPLNPLTWEDPARQLSVGAQIATVLYELADTTRDNAGGLSFLASRRDIHLLSVAWERACEAPTGTPDSLREYLSHSLPMTAPAKALVIGVKLRSSVTDQMLRNATSKGIKGAFEQVKAVATSRLGEEVPDLSAYESDRQVVDAIFRRNGCTPLTASSYDQLEAWYSRGVSTDVTVYETKDFLQIPDGDRIELAAVMKFENPIMRSPSSPWLLDAMTSTDGPAVVVSIRGVIEPATIARNRARNAQRRVIAQQEEDAASGDLGRIENQETFNLAQEIEGLFASGEPLISQCSIILGRRVGSEVDTYVDELRTRYGIRVRPLEHRQLAALDETLPCSAKRLNPFLQDVTVPVLAYAGLSGFGHLGDGTGLYVGLSAPDGVPVYLNPLGAPAADKSPGMLIAGDSGSGKTFLAMSLATQATLAGQQTIFINPKGFDSIEPFAKLVGGEVVKMTNVDGQDGFFDPFRFCAKPTDAAKVATDFILDVLGTRGVAQGLTQTQELRLGAGLQRGAEAGARCVGEALRYVEDRAVVDIINEQAKADPTFRLGIAPVPRDTYRGHHGLTLIEFDRQLDFPESSTQPSEYSRAQRIAIAAIRLVTRCCMEMLASSKGGVLVLDEAWVFLSSSEGLATVQRLGRLGRSQNILPIFCTQRVDDLLKEGVDMESHITRVFVLSLKEERDARGALKLCGLEASRSRLQWLLNAGPRRGSDSMPARPAYALHKDLQGRHAAVLIGPVPEAARIAFSTNPLDRQKRDEAQGSDTGRG